jgi:ankyrin repeat protein
MDVPEPDERDARAIVDAAEVGNLEGNLEEVRRLAEQDRRLLDINDGENTPLTAAAERGRVEVVRYLLDEGAEANLPSPLGGSALEVACRTGHLKIASLLLAHGADAAARDDERRTPLMFASAYGHPKIVALLLAHGCGDIDRPHSRSNEETALHHASYYGRPGALRALLGAGADPHVVDRDDRTPLAMAVRRGHEECVALLQVSSVSQP